MKVFIGANENCGMIHYLNIGFNVLNHEVTTLIKNDHRFEYDGQYTFKVIPNFKTQENKVKRKLQTILETWRYNRRLKRHFAEIKENDLFIFIWDTILPDFKDLEKLREQNKKIVFLFIGSEVRHVTAFKQEFQNNKISWTNYLFNEDLNKKMRFIRKVELLADKIYSVPDQAGLQIVPYNHFFLPLDISNIKFNFPDNKIPVIIHAPSNPGLKGTKLVLNALDKLKQEGVKFDLKLLENVSNADVKKALSDADIAIDQVHLHGPGMFGLEAMAFGCAVATRYLKQHTDVFSPPVCYIDDTDQLIDNLRELIVNRKLRKELAFKGRAFVEQHNSPSHVAQTILESLKEDVKPDYYPRFFLDHYVLTNEELENDTKKLNCLVIKKLDSTVVDFASLKQRGLI